MAGAGVFKDDRAIRSSDRWLDQLQQAVAGCRAFIVLIGRDGVQRWVGAEVGVALNRHLSPHGDAARLPIHPVLLGDTPVQSLPPFLALFQAERWQPGAPIPAGLLHALLHDQLRLDSHPRFEGCPFLGLGAFKREHAELFFGRRAETLQALAGLGDQQQTSPDKLHGGNGHGYHRWLQIEGHSGSGKSSLVHAGLLPMVEHGALWPRTGFGHWRIVGPMMPGRDPLTRLAEAVEAEFVDEAQRDIARRRDRFMHDPSTLALDLRGFKQRDTGFLLVIDQFEELFTLVDAAQRQPFDALLAHALQDAECPLFLVTTIRVDFLDRIGELPHLSGLYNARCKRYLLSTITSAGLREAIEMPAQLAGLDVSGITAAMLESASGEDGALPLVENALLQLWEERTDNKLSSALYHARKGLAGMLSSGADALLKRIESAVPAGRAAALELLFALTKINRGSRHTRQRITRAEAVQAAGNGNAALGEQVLQMLIGQRADEVPSDADTGSVRLVTASVEGDTAYVDLIHETLLRARGASGAGTLAPFWPTLHAYIEANRDRDVLRQQLDLQAQRWQRGGRITRWFHLAGWGQLLDYRRLRPMAHSLEGRFLARSRRVAWMQGAVVFVLFAALVQALWWVTVNGLPITYLFAQPRWFAAQLLRQIPEPETVPMRPGTFTMGCKVGRDVDAETSCVAEGLPVARVVKITEPCAMGKFAVTFWQYDYYVWAHRPKPGAEVGYPSDAGFGRGDRPVINVSWHEAQAYVAWLAEESGKAYRLPTEEEWEYAARGGREARYPWGDAAPAGRANCGECGDPFSNRSTAPVGSYEANGFGLYDMAGNVWQWVADQGADEAARVVRGGSWYDGARGLRAADRFDGSADLAHDLIGFRVCRGSPIEPPVAGALDAVSLHH